MATAAEPLPQTASRHSSQEIAEGKHRCAFLCRICPKFHTIQVSNAIANDGHTPQRWLENGWVNSILTNCPTLSSGGTEHLLLRDDFDNVAQRYGNTLPFKVLVAARKN
jgi:hypothetical protein